MEVNKVFDRPASQAFYSVAGRLLFIESFNPELRNLIVDLFAGWQLTPVALPDRPAEIQINFACGEAPLSIPRDLEQFEIADGGKCYTGGTVLYLELGGAVVHLENGSLVSVSFTELPRLGDPLLGRAASFAVCAALRRFGLFDLHSGGVVEPESGKGVLIIGPSGTGKSTLVLQLVQAGWSYLSDDELLLSLEDGTVEARGFRSFFAVNTNERLKRCFELETKPTERASPRLLLFISLNRESRSQMHRLTQAETMTRFLRSCPWATYDRSIAGANLELLSTLARQASGFDLLAGRDLLSPGFAASFLRQALQLS